MKRCSKTGPGINCCFNIDYIYIDIGCTQSCWLSLDNECGLALHCSILDIACLFFFVKNEVFFSFFFSFSLFFRYKNDYNVNCSRHDYLISQFTDKHFSQMNGDMRKPTASFSNRELLYVGHNKHQESISLKSPLLYSKIGVCRGIPTFLIFVPKHRLWVLVRTPLVRWF